MHSQTIRFEAGAHRYTVNGTELPGVTRILAASGVADFSAPWFHDGVKQRGTLVHQAIALDAEGDLDYDLLEPRLVGYVDGWRRYLAERRATVLHSERIVYDLTVGYAGTLDAIVNEDGSVRPTLIDIKPALYPSVGPQTAAYARCARALFHHAVAFQRAALVLPGDGTYQRIPLTDADDEPVFLAAARIFHWRQKHGHRH